MTQYPAYNQQFAVDFDYPVHFARDVFNAANPLLAETLDRKDHRRPHRCVAFVDAGLAAAQGQIVAQIKEYFHSHADVMELAGAVEMVPGGEAAKTGWSAVRDAMWNIGNLHLDRQSFVLAVGGGSVLDMVGFAASLVHRGLRLIRLPSTTLAQCDAGVGVKNGMDEHGMKNFVGTFAPPFAVINDFSLLASLSQEHWLGGLAEAFKVAIIKDADLLDFLCRHAEALARRDQALMEQAVYRAALLHLEHIRTGGDPFEFGSARPLDFGHWAAHRLEAMTAFRLGHGQAVAMGIAIDLVYAARQGLLTAAEMDRVLAAMRRCGLALWCAEMELRDEDGSLLLIDGLEQFREHLGGHLTVTLPQGLGRKTEVHQVNPQHVEDAVAALKALSATNPTSPEAR